MGKSNGEKLSTVSKINFERVAGKLVENQGKLTYFDFDAGVPKNKNVDLEQPMLMKYTYLPIAGSSDTYVVNVMNQACAAFYNAIRRRNVSVNNYGAADVAKYLLAAAGLNVAYNETVRDYKLMFTRKFTNMGYGRMINTALTGSDTSEHVGYLQERLLKLKEKIEQFPVIKLPIFDDWMELSAKVYKDDDIEKAGLIVFKMEKVPYWNVNSTDPYIGAITYKELPINLTSRIAALYSIASLYEFDTDVQEIATEIAHDRTLESYDLLDPTSDRIEPEFKMEMVDACHNAQINSVNANPKANYPSASVIPGIQEDITGSICNTIHKSGNKGLGIFIADSVMKPNVAMSDHDDCIKCNEYDKQHIIFAHVDKPTDKYIYDITKFMFTRRSMGSSEYSSFTDKNDAQTKLENLGTVLLTSVTLYWYNQSLNTIESNTNYCNWTNDITFADKWLTFAACPVFFKFNVDTNRRYSSYNMKINGDIDNFAVISNDILSSIQQNRNLQAWKLDSSKLPE